MSSDYMYSNYDQVFCSYVTKHDEDDYTSAVITL